MENWPRRSKNLKTAISVHNPKSKIGIIVQNLQSVTSVQKPKSAIKVQNLKSATMVQNPKSATSIQNLKSTTNV